MSSEEPRPSPRALPDWSAVPSNSEDDRVLLNLRVAYFGRVVFAFSAFFLVAIFLIGLTLGLNTTAFPKRIGMVFHLGATLIFGGQWLACRKAQRSARALNVIDAGGLPLGMACFATMATQDPRGYEQALILLLITMTAVTLHAIMIPATARRTFWLSTVSIVPSLFGTYRIARHLSAASAASAVSAALPWVPITRTIYAAQWAAVTVATATLASRVIYGLSQRVRAATELGQYTLEEKIGEGGMGIVYRARHALLRRPTAVKLLPRERAGARNVQRFEREVQLTSSLTHPNTIAIYDYGHTPDGVFYYAMEYLDGITLEDLVAHDGPQPAPRVVHLLRQICGALQEAHGIGLIHRDIKPANLMLCVRGDIPDQVKVLDFGLVKEIRGDASPDGSTMDAFLGTPLYMAPEAIADPNRIDARTDLYALGAVAYQLLTGKPVFEGNTLVEVCAKHLHEQPVPPSVRAGAEMLPALETLVLACLAKAPTSRPPSAAAILSALDDTGVAAWTSDDARAWWRNRASAVKESIHGVKSKPSTLAGQQTVQVDWVRRSGSEGTAP